MSTEAAICSSDWLKNCLDYFPSLSANRQGARGLTFHKLIITLLSIFVSAALLSLNFMTVESGQVGASSDVKADALTDPELEPAVLRIDTLKYAQFSPEPHYLQRVELNSASWVPGNDTDSNLASFGLILNPEASQDQTGNFGLKKVQITLDGGTVQLQTTGPKADLQSQGTAKVSVASRYGFENSIVQNFHLDDHNLHNPLSDQQAIPGNLEDQEIPVIEIQYDSRGNYDARKTWANVDMADLLARAMLAEENEKLFDPERVLDFIGAGWVMVNRTQKADGFFPYADENLYGALVPYFQFALGGVKDIQGKILPGNAAIVANPEFYPGWFGNDPQTYYWKAYRVAAGILNGKIPDPTGGAMYFADFYLNEDGFAAPFEDGRTRFWFRGYASYSIPELREVSSIPWISQLR
jgi:hypothetical protein